jgi:L-ascorbate metabolism protein UlaG (beta-lactamase superfamily)
LKRLRAVSLGIVVALTCLGGLAAWSAGDGPGARAQGERLARMQASPQWTGEGFGNRLKRVDGPFTEMLSGFFFGGQEHRAPDPEEVDFLKTPSHLDEPAGAGGRVTWFGHSSLLVELEGARLLIDPVWSDRASPFTWAGPKRFYPAPLALESLVDIDAVIISHDHYDHLDMNAVKTLADREISWLCPLGVGAHLEAWGVAPTRITELDWWEAKRVGPVQVTATPSRHFSGRSIWFTDQNATLWAGWAIVGQTHRIFYSGDTALHPDFETIGDRLGPFDLTIMETGAYDALWPDVHLGPEQAVLAHRMLRGGVMMPVHWGTFDLALHGWVEPIERVLRAAERLGVDVAVPRPGEAVLVGEIPPEVVRWWPARPWRSVDDAPAWSTGVEALQAPLRDPDASTGAP